MAESTVMSRDGGLEEDADLPLNVDGRDIRGWPKKTWVEVLKSDLRVLGLLKIM